MFMKSSIIMMLHRPLMLVNTDSSGSLSSSTQTGSVFSRGKADLKSRGEAEARCLLSTDMRSVRLTQNLVRCHHAAFRFVRLKRPSGPGRLRKPGLCEANKAVTPMGRGYG